MLSGLGFILESLPPSSPTDPTYEAGKFMIQLSRRIWGGGKGRDTSFWLTLSRRKRGLCSGSVGLSTAPPTWSRWSADPGQEPGSVLPIPLSLLGPVRSHLPLLQAFAAAAGCFFEAISPSLPAAHAYPSPRQHPLSSLHFLVIPSPGV